MQNKKEHNCRKRQKKYPVVRTYAANSVLKKRCVSGCHQNGETDEVPQNAGKEEFSLFILLRKL